LPFVLSAAALETASEQQMRDLAAGRAKWTDPEFKGALAIMAAIGKNGWYQQGYTAAAETTDEPRLFEGGKAAFAIGLMGDGLHWKMWGDAMGYDNIGVVPVPAAADGSPVGVIPGELAGTVGVSSSTGLAIPTWSKHPEEATLLMRFTLDPAVQKEMATASGAPFPGIKASQAAWAPQPIFGDLVKLANESKAADLLTYIGYGYLPTLIAQLQSLSGGKTTVDSAAQALENAATAAAKQG
jgi:ABC-type glycerol-3-phosphate transport system substrate-binding protein